MKPNQLETDSVRASEVDLSKISSSPGKTPQKDIDLDNLAEISPNLPSGPPKVSNQHSMVTDEDAMPEADSDREMN